MYITPEEGGMVYPHIKAQRGQRSSRRVSKPESDSMIISESSPKMKVSNECASWTSCCALLEDDGNVGAEGSGRIGRMVAESRRRRGSEVSGVKVARRSSMHAQ